jgi:phosphoglycerate dehydrogenase-like enzyme
MPLTPETRDLLGCAELGLLRSGAVVVNDARPDLRSRGA